MANPRARLGPPQPPDKDDAGALGVVRLTAARERIKNALMRAQWEWSRDVMAGTASATGEGKVARQVEAVMEALRLEEAYFYAEDLSAVVLAVRHPEPGMSGSRHTDLMFLADRLMNGVQRA